MTIDCRRVAYFAEIVGVLGCDVGEAIVFHDKINE